jgi:prepilin-type N-terminal cleavage/methylation domain-containing protein
MTPTRTPIFRHSRRQTASGSALIDLLDLNSRRETNPQKSAAGFTLIELLVVMSIIVIIIAVMVPTVNVLTGNRSLAAAQNRLSSILAAARQDAITNQTYSGVAFWPDINTKHTMVGYVRVRPTPVNTGATPAPIFNLCEFIEGSEIEPLQPGIGAQVQIGPPVATPGAGTTDEYAALGLIMFGPSGQLSTQPVYIEATQNQSATAYTPAYINYLAPPFTGPPPSHLDEVFQLGVTSAPQTLIFPTGVAVALYDQQAFANAGFSEFNYLLLKNVNSSNLMSLFMTNAAQPNCSPSATEQQSKEQWIDQNSTPLMINQTTGSVVQRQ